MSYFWIPDNVCCQQNKDIHPDSYWLPNRVHIYCLNTDNICWKHKQRSCLAQEMLQNQKYWGSCRPEYHPAQTFASEGFLRRFKGYLRTGEIPPSPIFFEKKGFSFSSFNRKKYTNILLFTYYVFFFWSCKAKGLALGTSGGEEKVEYKITGMKWINSWQIFNYIILHSFVILYFLSITETLVSP